MSNWVLPAISSRNKPLLVLKKKKEKASLGSNSSFKPHCSTQPVLLLQPQGGIALLLAPCLPCRTQASPQTLPAGVSYSPLKSNHHLKDGFCEGKKKSIITMVIPVTASEINLSKSSRNTCKKHKPVELQSFWEQGFTKEDYKFPSGLNNARCSQFFPFLIPCRATFLPWAVNPPEKLPYKSKNQDLIPSTLMFWFSDCRVIRTRFLSLLQRGRETEPKPSHLYELFAKCSSSQVKCRLHPVKSLSMC